MPPERIRSSIIIGVLALMVAWSPSILGVALAASLVSMQGSVMGFCAIIGGRGMRSFCLGSVEVIYHSVLYSRATKANEDSSGAYTVRALSSLIADIGLLDPYGMEHFHEIYEDWKNQNVPSMQVEGPVTDGVFKGMDHRPKMLKGEYRAELEKVSRLANFRS